MNIAGRGSDIAGASLADLSTKKKDTGLSSYRRLEIQVTRFKSTIFGSHVLAPHRDSFLLCMCFSLEYTVVMYVKTVCHTRKILSTVATKMAHTSNDVESKVSIYLTC